MTRRARRMTAAIVGVICVLLAITPFLIHANQFRPLIEGRASAALGRRVDLGNLKLSLTRASLTTETLVIADDPEFSNAPFLKAKSVSVGVELLPLILSRSLQAVSWRPERFASIPRSIKCLAIAGRILVAARALESPS